MTIARLKMTGALAVLAASLALSSVGNAQQPPPQFPDMTFFITSTGGKYLARGAGAHRVGGFVQAGVSRRS